MRFFDDGPDIPDDLLQARDDGNVVFLCGAGVSFESKMPSFPGLTDLVIKGLRVPAHSPIMSDFEPWRKGDPEPKVPLDRIFQDIYDLYDRKEVDSLITEALQIRVTGDDMLSVGKEHATIARISTDSDRRPRIITTNFDLLFEHAFEHFLCIDEPTVYVPPALPIIEPGQELTGITHMHGQLQTNPSVMANYIVSSSQFGSAYLAAGWATRFLQSLLSNYTVVFVGYGAEDFPVDYLLQGLTHHGPNSKNAVYAFYEGSTREIERKWQRRGVKVIPYPNHKTLWKTLKAWASWAEDPIAHRERIAHLAKTSPRELTPAQRGQVVNLVSSESGAQIFARAEPPPHPEWIFVLDSRFRTTGRFSVFESDPAFPVPSIEFGIDSDPDHAPSPEPRRTVRADSLLAKLPNDDTFGESHLLSNLPLPDYRFVPRRLRYLIWWIARGLKAPEIAWWVRQQRSLHPVLIRILRSRLGEEKSIHPNARKVWNILLEYHSDRRRKNRSGLVVPERRIASEDWTSGTLRQLGAWATPFFDVDPDASTYDLNAFPSSWGEISVNQFLGLRVSFADDLGPMLDVPREWRQSMLSIMERSLQQAGNMRWDLGTTNHTPPICYPDREDERELPDRDTDKATQLLLHLFTQLSKDFPAVAHAHANVWASQDSVCFRSLTLCAMNQKKVFNADEIMVKLNELPQEEFWDFQVRRELIFLLADRWSDFSPEHQQALVERLLRGPELKAGKDDNQSETLRLRIAALYTASLIAHGAEVADAQQRQQLADLIGQIPDWQEDMVSDLTVEYDEDFSFLGLEKSSNPLLDTPTSHLIDRAEMLSEASSETHVHSKPFIEVVEKFPENALGGLQSKMKSGEYPVEYWEQLLRHWPEETNLNLLQDLLQAVARLPHEIIGTLGPSLGDWVENHWTRALVTSEDFAWQALDNSLAGLQASIVADQADSAAKEGADSSKTPSDGQALDHPISRMARVVAENLLSALAFQGPAQGTGLPTEYTQRLETLFPLPEARAHLAVTVLTSDVPQLYQADPQWTEHNLFPCFDVEHPLAQAAWNGLTSSSKGIPRQLSPTIIENLPRLFPEASNRNWEEEISRFAARAIVSLFSVNSERPEALTAEQVQDCIRNMSDDARTSVIYSVGQQASSIDNGWITFFIPFVKNAWPKETDYQSGAETYAWVTVLRDAGETFPQAFEAIQYFMVPSQTGVPDLHLYRYDSDDHPALAKRFPETVLRLVDAIIPNNPTWVPYDLRAILQMLEEAKPELRTRREWQRLFNVAHRI